MKNTTKITENSTITAIATPLMTSAIGVIRMSGSNAIEIADKIFSSKSNKKLCSCDGYTAHYGVIKNGEEIFDHCIATVFKAPHSYTGENVVEFSLHGGVLLVTSVLHLLLENGANLATPGEFSKRAFLNGKMDLSMADAVMDSILAENNEMARAAQAALSGKTYNQIHHLADKLTSLAAQFNAWIDFPEDDIPEVSMQSALSNLKEVQAELQTLLKQASIGQVFKEGINTVIIGSPNVGKSTLMNRLAGVNKSIVTEVAGTTRDVIEEHVRISLEGHPEITLNIADTAGIRATTDIIESIGVKLARERLAIASLILIVFDGSMPILTEELNLLEEIAQKEQNVIAVINKCDLASAFNTQDLNLDSDNIVKISANDEQCDLTSLYRAIYRKINLQSLLPNVALLSGERQLNAAREALTAVCEAISAIELSITPDAVAVCIESALDKLLMLSGEKVSETVVNEVFSRFCLGK